MPAPNRCEICGEPTERPIDCCRRCEIDYHKQVGEGWEAMAGLVWAARRARWFAALRSAAKNARAAGERAARRRA